MTNDEFFCSWALKELEERMRWNMPASKAVRLLKADARESRKALNRARRSHVAQQAAIKRKLNQRLVEIEKGSRDRRDVQAAEMEKRRWEILTASR